jgi:hypothetical protein
MTTLGFGLTSISRGGIEDLLGRTSGKPASWTIRGGVLWSMLIIIIIANAQNDWPAPVARISRRKWPRVMHDNTTSHLVRGKKIRVTTSKETGLVGFVENMY